MEQKRLQQHRSSASKLVSPPVQGARQVEPRPHVQRADGDFRLHQAFGKDARGLQADDVRIPAAAVEADDEFDQSPFRPADVEIGDAERNGVGGPHGGTITGEVPKTSSCQRWNGRPYYAPTSPTPSGSNS